MKIDKEREICCFHKIYQHTHAKYIHNIKYINTHINPQVNISALLTIKYTNQIISLYTYIDREKIETNGKLNSDLN